LDDDRLLEKFFECDPAPDPNEVGALRMRSSPAYVPSGYGNTTNEIGPVVFAETASGSGGAARYVIANEAAAPHSPPPLVPQLALALNALQIHSSTRMVAGDNSNSNPTNPHPLIGPM
jgi:hypothetical protein